MPERLKLITDAEDLVLYVHLVCGASIWWDERPVADGGDGPITGHGCDVCSGDARPDPDGLWRRAWAMQPWPVPVATTQETKP